MSDTKISEAAPAAWLHEEDSDRVVSAAQKATAIRDGGASASSVKPYTVAAYTHPQPAELAFDVEEMLTACVPGGSIVDPQVVADNIRAWFADRKPAELAEQQGVGDQWIGEDGPQAIWVFIDWATNVTGYSETGAELARPGERAVKFVRAPVATRKQQVGEVQGDALAALAEKWRTEAEAISAEEDANNSQENYGGFLLRYVSELQAALAARQPGAQERVAWASTGATGHKVVAMPGLHKLPYGDYDLYAAPPAQSIDLGPGVRAIADERQRQVDAEGYNTENDADYKAGELANAALAYVEVAAMDLAAGGHSHIATRAPPACWPWHRLWWKPRDARRDLVRAGALIAAQLDVIDSASDAAPGVSRG